jgi:hypothetical protein
MNIYEKILAIMQDVQYLAKDDHVKFGQQDYKALSEEKVTSVMRDELIKNQLVVFPIAQEANRNGNITHVDTKYRMVNVEKPDEFIEIVSCGDGADTQDKGSGKAMTYAFKYMWLRVFALPTGEDPDKISSAELDDKAKKEADKKAKEEEKKKAEQVVMCTANEINALHEEISRVGGDETEWVEYVAKKSEHGPKPKKLEEITKKQFLWSMKILGAKPTKAET